MTVLVQAMAVTEPIDIFMVSIASGKLPADKIEPEFDQLCQGLEEDPDTVREFVSALVDHGAFEDHLLICIPEDARALIGLEQS